MKQLLTICAFIFWSAMLVADEGSSVSNHWAFLPPARPLTPKISNTFWARNPIDGFIMARLEREHLRPAMPADRPTLIRRVTLDLIGLPPTPAEVDAFANDPSSNAFARVVDRLLASAHYGERWGRHWLDLARYAESDGFEHDAVRPHSWRYRDYVIRAFNQDKPFDQFISEQIAGDELWPDNPDALIATGFNLLGPDMVDSADQIQRRLNTLNDMVDTAASVFLGVTLGCARCHDHKFEPFTQQDYFSMQAFFAPAVFDREHPVPTVRQAAAHTAAIAAYNARTQTQRGRIAEIEGPYRQKLFEEKLSKLSEDAQLAHRTPKERRTMEQEGTVQETAAQVKVTDAEVIKALSKEDGGRRAALEAELKSTIKPPPLPEAMVLQDTNGPAPKTCVLARGDYNNPREEVGPAFPEILNRCSSSNPGSDPARASRAEAVNRSRRGQLANWITSPENPLTARVMVNRIWQHHFGRGLVTTSSDFGTRGEAPTHPELLDWLAREFIARNWSIKEMHRLILLSATYQQSSTASSEALSLDPRNKLLSHQNRIRLEGELIRDSLLAVSGQLNEQMGGPGISPPIAADLMKTAKNWAPSPNSAEHTRRSIYIFARRNLRYPFLEVFDAPDSNLSCPERGRSTTAPQSLTLLNSEEVMAAAKAAAARLSDQSSSKAAEIERAYISILNRKPSEREAAFAFEFLQTAPLTELCRALFNLNDFVYAN